MQSNQSDETSIFHVRWLAKLVLFFFFVPNRDFSSASEFICSQHFHLHHDTRVASNTPRYLFFLCGSVDIETNRYFYRPLALRLFLQSSDLPFVTAAIDATAK